MVNSDVRLYSVTGGTRNSDVVCAKYVVPVYQACNQAWGVQGAQSPIPKFFSFASTSPPSPKAFCRTPFLWTDVTRSVGWALQRSFAAAANFEEGNLHPVSTGRLDQVAAGPVAVCVQGVLHGPAGAEHSAEPAPPSHPVFGGRLLPAAVPGAPPGTQGCPGRLAQGPPAVGGTPAAPRATGHRRPGRGFSDFAMFRNPSRFRHGCGEALQKPTNLGSSSSHTRKCLAHSCASKGGSSNVGDGRGN